ncbi:MAG: peptidoglycan editing factor PgeF [Pseudomonadota bacterium]
MIFSRLISQTRFLAGFSTRNESVHDSAGTKAFHGAIFRVSQVHSSTVGTVTEEDTPHVVRGIELDGLVTGRPGILLTVWTADCVPVLLAHRDGACVAAVHAGWRGLAAGILGEAVDVMRSEFNADPDAIVASVGPSIGKCCFEVGEDVAARLVASCSEPGVIARKDGKPLADLREIARLQLLAASVPASGIEVIDECTRCNADLFFSHRRGNLTERQCGFIGILPEHPQRG